MKFFDNVTVGKLTRQHQQLVLSSKATDLSASVEYQSIPCSTVENTDISHDSKSETCFDLLFTQGKCAYSQPCVSVERGWVGEGT